ncbi:MAG: flavodoxin family protein [Candidatus Ranarchaeia archaeon]|jgi:flavodoxin
MKTLVAYFSRTGSNRTIAEHLAQTLKADLDEITDHTKRKGKIGWIRAGRDSSAKKLTKISVNKNPKDYDRIILGGPKWAFNLIPPLRSYATQFNFQDKEVAFFTVCLSGEADDVHNELDRLMEGAQVMATLTLTEKSLKENYYQEKLQKFIDELKS